MTKVNGSSGGTSSGSIAIIRQDQSTAQAQPLDVDQPRPFPWTALLVDAQGNKFVAEARANDRKGQLVAFKPINEAGPLEYSLAHGAAAAEIVDIQANLGAVKNNGQFGAFVRGAWAALARERTGMLRQERTSWLRD
jgi:hypothetical protein